MAITKHDSHNFVLEPAEHPSDDSAAMVLGSFALARFDSSFGMPLGAGGAEVIWIDGARFEWRKDGADVKTWPGGAEVLPERNQAIAARIFDEL